ncbi:hypothetical protein DFJ43DRAFT_796947 [Lentinula guzmanii]|uniref:Uncharacterized protein n=1 Tax=Lentinula guzmanii TaxID=2804957 RepID=A0AA38JBB7_9AGAR|nr:hypothetical protein DFJ43DRAFT_796947 [Lentinula guzmanii]
MKWGSYRRDFPGVIAVLICYICSPVPCSSLSVKRCSLIMLMCCSANGRDGSTGCIRAHQLRSQYEHGQLNNNL